MIRVFYTIFGKESSNSLFGELPQFVIDEASKYRRPEDRLSRLYGKLLLMEGLRRMNYDAELIKSMQYTLFNRPYLNSTLDFNISHAGQCVVCVLSNFCRVGIDVEMVKSLDMSDFNHVWTQQEIEGIRNSEIPEKQFYIYWTRKEAVMKADGRGLNLDLSRINVVEKTVQLDRDCWNLSELYIDSGYIAHLATDTPLNSAIVLEKLKFTPD